MDPTPHPSFLELDRVPLGQGAPQTAEHVKDCARCQTHLRKLEEPLPMPAWATALRRPQPTRKPRWWTLALLGGAAAAGATAVLLLSSKPHPREVPMFPAQFPGGLVAAKGSPSVALYLKRGEQVSLWDGRAPVRPGDRLRLEVAVEGLGRVLVAAPGGFAQPLFSGAVDPKQGTLLPTSWVVDDSPGDETLIVVLSAVPLSAEEASAAVAAHRRDDRIWTTELTIPKAAK